ncbi:MAG: sigma 54-interacting transcriptional regulator [Anaerovoracaceae bacterium]
MSELAKITEYVQKMAHLISIVLEMDVTICDSDLDIIGDWNRKLEISEAGIHLKDDSVISTAIRNNEVVIYDDAKTQSAGCIHCSRRSSCNTESIIAFPLENNGVVVGGIGIYSEENRQKTKLITEQKAMIDFISSVGNLIINQLEEKTLSLQMASSNRRMDQIIETLDFALVSIDENNEILYYNEKFRSIVPSYYIQGDTVNYDERSDLKGRNVSDLFEGLVIGGKREKVSSVFLKKNHTSVEYEVTYSPISVDEKYMGALLYFKEAAKVLEKASQLLQPVKKGSFDEIVGVSQAIRNVKEDAARFAKSTSNVLIQGESGTGKEVFAGAIHNASRCAEGPFVAVNCAAIPDNLLESELFGYEEGAFTGASKGGRAGKFEIANHGTLFLDEIGEMPIHLQPKILRALQERKIMRVGSNRPIDIDIRIIAATNRDLLAMMKTGEFREDLYYRLSVIPIYIPALRERKEDIKPLLDYFLNMYRSMLEKWEVQDFDASVIQLFYNYGWPGNVRELQNAVEYAVNRCEESLIHIDDVPERIRNFAKNGIRPIPLKQMEMEAIQNALLYFGNTPEGKEKAAAAMGISRATMYRKLKEYELG